jgi:hypothetical protein
LAAHPSAIANAQTWPLAHVETSVHAVPPLPELPPASPPAPEPPELVAPLDPLEAELAEPPEVDVPVPPDEPFVPPLAVPDDSPPPEPSAPPSADPVDETEPEHAPTATAPTSRTASTFHLTMTNVSPRGTSLQPHGSRAWEPEGFGDVGAIGGLSMTRDEVRNRVDAWARAVGSCDVEALARLTAPALREGVVARTRGVHGAFRDVEVTPLQVVIEGDTVAWRWRLSGRHVGAIAGIAPSGEPASVEGVNFQRIVDGVVVDHWTTVDVSGLTHSSRVA